MPPPRHARRRGCRRHAGRCRKAAPVRRAVAGGRVRRSARPRPRRPSRPFPRSARSSPWPPLAAPFRHDRVTESSRRSP
ncbi:hypothetical protein DLJ49_17690 [Rhodovulum sp. 12E13]|nr:hypothetical protein DLJ49_17690 [Rhodovulum sp. 12E13]